MRKPESFAVCGAGFIGLNLIQRLLAESGSRVSVLDRKPPPPQLDSCTHWVQGDFADPAVLRRALAGVDVAFHLVSTTVPGDDHVGPLQELAENISATLRFMDVCAETGVGRIVFISSSSVYGLQAVTPIPETAETTPISSHGIHKLTIEKYLLLRRFAEETDVRILRLSNPFGPGQSLVGRQGFIAIAIGKLLAGEPLLLRGNGSPVRDFIYITDVCEALVAAALAESPSPVTNVGTGIGHSLADVVAQLNELSGRELSVSAGPLRKADIPVSVLDVALANRTLGFQPVVGLRDGLARTVRHHHIDLQPRPKG